MPRGVAQGRIISLPDAMTIFVCTSYKKKLARKNNEVAFYSHSTSSVYSIAVLLALLGYTPYRRAHDRSVLEKIHTAPLEQNTKLLHRMICMISRRASQFALQLRDRQEARRGTCGVGYGTY